MELTRKGYKQNLMGVWFGCFLFSFLFKTKNGNENVFGLISENKMKTGNN